MCACKMCGTVVVSFQFIMCLLREDIANSLSGHKMQMRKRTPLPKQLMQAACSEVLSGFTFNKMNQDVIEKFLSVTASLHP